MKELNKKELRLEVKNIIFLFISQEMAFTAVDITNHLRIKNIFVRNAEVAKILRKNVLEWSHKNILMYQCSMIKVDSENDGDIYAYLFHNKDFDPDNYLSRDTTTIRTV